MNKTVLTSFTILCLLSTVFLMGFSFNIQTVKASGTIYIKADGSIDPPTAAIFSVDNVTYTFTDNIYDEIVVERDNIVVDGAGYTIEGTGAIGSVGIDLSDRNNITIKNMQIKRFSWGIHLRESSNNSISGNNITANNLDAIYLGSSSGNNISRNNITKNEYGIMLYESSNNSVSRNNIKSNLNWGIRVAYSSNNDISGNNITSNEFGVELYWSSNNVLRRNNMVNKKYNFDVEGAFVNDADASNTVDSKHIYYWVSRRDMVVPADAGYVALINSHNITVKGLQLKNNVQGVLLFNTTNSQIENNNITNNAYGISLMHSSSNSISGNILSANNKDGVLLASHSSSNSISRNSITSSEFGIRLWATYYQGNSISGNSIINNEFGIYLFTSNNNNIHHNNFINNTNQAQCLSGSLHNIWDLGYSSGGNYWSDYNGTDLYGGPYQNETGYDWIGDFPYIIDENNRDNYPLTHPSPPYLLLEYAKIRSDLNVLRETIDSLNSTLQERIDSLNFTTQTSIDNLQENLMIELSNIRNTMYVLIATTIILIVTTVYFAIRKPKTKP